MKSLMMLVLCLLAAWGSPAAVSPDYEALKADAEKLYAERSFAKAHARYFSLDPTNLPPADQRWVQFRLADTQWRAEASTEQTDSTKLDQARHQLEALVRDVKSDAERDRVWAEVQESLGDFFWTRGSQQNWSEAWPHFQQGLDWWAGAADIELARQRYLAIVWRMTRPPGLEAPDHYFSGGYMPFEILQNALTIAGRDGDKARAHFLIAMTLRNQGGNWEQRARIPEEFEAAIKMERRTDWYDDALYSYAEWMMGQGRVIQLPNGNWQTEPDYAKALELFRRLVSEFDKGATRYWEPAQQQIRNITEPQLGVSLPNIFLPDSEVQYVLNWRNVDKIDLTIYPVELNRDVKLPGEESNARDWLSAIDLTGREKLKSWTFNPHPALSRPTGEGARRAGEGFTNDYHPGTETLRLDQKLDPGAYLIEARGGGKSARELILVTDAALVLKTSGKQALVYVCSALDGSPVPEARVKLWESRWEENRWRSRAREKDADTNGLAVFDLEARPTQNRQFIATAIRGDRQAFSLGNNYWSGRQEQEWKIYAFTDRPAYRPKETVNWKFTARQYNGSVYSTPANAGIEVEITDPRGVKVKAGQVTLNTFGSAWGSLALTEQMPLGEYRVSFRQKGRPEVIGDATLFRLEEYKLPEFKVAVQTPEENGKKKAFRLGEQVEVTVQADYYFGGPVSEASVEILVHQNPYWHWWREPRDFAWFYEDMDNPQGRWGRSYGGDQIIKRATLKTDATGKAVLTFDTPANAGQDFEYRIEARVTDASRREITGSRTVRVTRQRYYVHPQPEHTLYRPQDQVTLNFHALDANEQPVEVEGTVKVTRDYWIEIWLAPDGHEVKGGELKRLQSQRKIWPPTPARPDQKEWRLKFRGYEHDDILTRTLKTDTNGEAALSFTPEREGYYRVAWSSADEISNLKSQISNPIRAETTVWVADNVTTELGYRHGGVEIIADKDTFRVGQKAPVMLVGPTSDRYVLFSVEGEDLYSYQLVHLEGTVKLLELALEEKHVPNVFLNAVLVNDRQMFVDTKQIVVPPAKNFLTVDVKADRPEYLPRDEGTLTITTKNDEGQPVSAEIALGLVDESVFYIQNEYAGDPRQFFFGTKRGQHIQTQTTMNQKAYAKLVEWENSQLVDERDKERRLLQARDREEDTSVDDGFIDSLQAGRAFGGLGGASRLSESAGVPLLGDVPMSGAMRKAKFNDPPAGLSLGLPVKAPAAGEPAVIVRTDFRSTVFWQPDIKTGADGKAAVKVKYPDSLTGWKASARAVSAANQFGVAGVTTRTKQPLMVRLQAPRFFVVGDIVTISAIINNNTDAPLDVFPALESFGGCLETWPLPDPMSTRPLSVPVKANGEARHDWTFKVAKAGELKFKLAAKGGKFSDAMEKNFIAYEHGIEKFIAMSGKIRLAGPNQGGQGAGDLTVKLDFPKQRKPGSTSLTVQVAPSLAVTMLDALPYLIDYPYGCTEQTMSRFLPAVITAKTLRDLGLKPEDVMGRVFGGIETNFAAATHPKGKRDLAELEKITWSSLERLYDFQHSDGGWAWWKEGESDHWMTAYVVWGLALAKDAGVLVKPEALSRSANYLRKTLVEEEVNPDMQAFMLHALGAYIFSQKQTKLTKFEETAFENLWKNREKLNAYSRALLALSAHYFGKTSEAKILIENLENGVKRDDRPDTSVLINSQLITHNSQLGTAHWGEDGIYRRWSEGGVEATAFALRALLAIDPQNKLIEPVGNWLIKNRRGAQWNSTRDTAIVVLALNDYLRASGELKPNLEYELIVNGSSVARKKISGEDAFEAPSRFAIDPKLIRDNNEIRIIRKQGDGPVYFAVEGRFFSTEEPITPAGNEIFVKRDYYKLVGRPTLLKGYVYDKQPLRDQESVASGERVEVVLTIEAKNNYEYLMFEDLKPAGLEAVEVRSGEALYARELKSGAILSPRSKVQSPKSNVQSPMSNSDESRAGVQSPMSPDSRLSAPDSLARRSGAETVRLSTAEHTGRARLVYQELRDRKVALFIDKLPEGMWQIRYDLRAEVPGQFHALPVVGQAMYVPEIRCNGEEIRIKVEEGR